MKIVLPRVKINGYVLALLTNIFPSYSISVWFLSIFIQPRFFSLPFLVLDGFRFRVNRWTGLLLTNVLIAVFTPLIGFLFNRQFNLLDIAYVLSALYAFLFLSTAIKDDENIRLFNKFLVVTLAINAGYIVLQLFFYYAGFPQLTMIHSNIPFHEISGYSIEPGILMNVPRYTGLFIESGPLTFFLCLSFLYLVQERVNFSLRLKIIVFLMILFSQSKFLLTFLPMLMLEGFFMRYFRRAYAVAIRPWFIGAALLIGVLVLLTFIFADFSFGEYLAANIPAYQLRLDSMRFSLTSLLDMAPFGQGLLGTNYDTPDAKFELNGIDIFSVVLSGYGVYMGLLMILSFLLFPVLASIKYKYTYCLVLVMGFLSSGSLLIPQYLFAIVYPVLAHYQRRADDILRRPARVDRIAGDEVT